jgi:nitrogen fixation protein FixH
MTAVDNDSIYSYTGEKEAGSTLTYSFSYQTGPNPDNDYTVESVPSECANENGFRQITVPNEDVVLKAVSYGSCDEAPPAKVKITFQVDMSETEVINNDVQVVIKNPWIWTALVDQGEGIWSATVEVSPNETYPYTFVNGGRDNWSGEEKVPAACNFGTESAPERHVTVTVSDTTLALTKFGECSSEVSASNVTFQVDLTQVNDLYEGGAVWVYMDANWNEYYELTDTDNDGIYSTTLLREAGTEVFYSYSYQTGADPNSDYVTETVPAECAAENGFRKMTVAAGDVTLPAVIYGQCNTSIPETVMVTFQVDMSETEVLNNDVQVVIKNPWIWTALSDQGEGIWSATVEVNSNATYPYTFVNGGQDNWSGEEKVPAECNFGTESAPERHVSVGISDTTLVLTKFAACPEVVTNPKITFQVDLNNVSDLYEGGAVWVYMDADWNEYYEMTDADNDGIYTYTLEKEAGSTVFYSYSYQTGADPNSDYVTEIVPNDCAAENGFRQLDLGAADVVLPVVAFGACDNNAPMTVKVTFQVNMSNTEVINNDVQVVIKNPWIWTALVDQGNGIWSASVEVNANATYPYTFVNGGQDNWSGEEKVPAECNMGTESAPERHVEVLGNDTTLSLVDFASCGTTVSAFDLEEGNISVYPNPAEDVVNISSGGDWIQSIRVMDISGKTVLIQNKINRHELKLDTGGLNSGLYFVFVQGEKFSSVSKLIIEK